MKLIPLTKGLFAKVDDEDWSELNKFKWIAGKAKKSDTHYAIRNQKEDGKIIAIKMHRVVMDITDTHVHIDHKDFDGLNCQKVNLRIATRSQNSANRKKLKNCSGKYKGVNRSWCNGILYYRAACKKEGKTHYRSADSELDAAIKYNELAVELHGEFACLNIFE